MSLFIDEQTPEDEELLEAVNELIDTVSLKVSHEISNDVQEIHQMVEAFVIRIVPRLMLYREDPTVVYEDLQNIGIFSILLLIALFVLRPTRPLIRRHGEFGKRGVSWNADTEDESDGTAMEVRWDESSDAIIAFESNYEKLKDTKYRRLILPPSCRKAPSSTVPSTPSQRKTTQKNTPTNDLDDPSSDNEDDDPAARLQRYTRELYYFARLLLVFDFTAAARLVLEWYQGIQKLHKDSSRSLVHQNEATADISSTTDNNRPDTIDSNLPYEEPLKEHCPMTPNPPPDSTRSRNRLGSTDRKTSMDVDTFDTTQAPSMDDEHDSGEDDNFFFDAPSSQHSLTKIQVNVPLPDANGYLMLGDEFIDDHMTPLLVFVNSRSGPQQGQLLITQLRRILNPIQVWDLADGGPEIPMDSFLKFTRLRILVCGGDGTVAWIVSTLEKYQKWPPIAILPLGTGNDLARIHGWGGGYNNESLIRILEQIDTSYVSLLDRWQVTIEQEGTKSVVKKSFFNYMGVGADAQASLHVHYLRESRPDWFFSRLVNKAFYGVFGAEDIIKANNRPARKELTLIADGVHIPLPDDSQGIILLNIDSYAGGVPLWSHGTNDAGFQQPVDTYHPVMTRCESTDDIAGMSMEERFTKVMACNRPSSCQDGYLDVISIRGAFHLGQIKVGLSNAQRLCQCREAVITIKHQVAVQTDGEPWRQKASRLTIERKADSAVMLHRSVDDGGIETEVGSLLDWAEERKMIDRQTHSSLMKEFSRRIEGRTRQRRNRAGETGVMSTLKKAISSGAISSQQKGWYQSGGSVYG